MLFPKGYKGITTVLRWCYVDLLHALKHGAFYPIPTRKYHQ